MTRSLCASVSYWFPNEVHASHQSTQVWQGSEKHQLQGARWVENQALNILNLIVCFITEGARKFGKAYVRTPSAVLESVKRLCRIMVRQGTRKLPFPRDSARSSANPTRKIASPGAWQTQIIHFMRRIEEVWSTAR